MKLNEVEKKLMELYRSERKVSALLLGAPGIGKSETVRRVAKKIAEMEGKEFVDYNDEIAEEILINPERYFVFVDFRLTETEPSDLLGIPVRKNGFVKYEPLAWAKVLSKTAGILFLDEITNVQRLDVQSIAYKLVLDRKAGFTKLSDKVLVVAAGNKPEHSSVANLLPAPLINRFCVIDVDPATVDEWAEYMNVVFEDKWDKRCYAFLKRFENENYILKLPNSSETLENFPSHRTWTELAVKLYEYKDLDYADCLIGKEVGTRFKAFVRAEVNFDKILENPRSFINLNLDQKYMLCLELASFISNNVKNQKKLMQAIDLLDTIYNEKRELFVFVCRNVSKSAKTIFYEKLRSAKEYMFKYLVDVAKIVIS